MFQEAADHRAHPDAFGQASHARAQGADAAHQEIDLHSGLRGVVERLDDFRFEQGIHLGDDLRTVPGACRVGLGLDQGEHRGMQGERRLEQVVQGLVFAQAGDLLEHFIDVVGDFLAGREQAEIGIETRRTRMVVAGAQMDVASVAAVLAAQDHQHLGVGFVAEHAVDDMGADFLQARGDIEIRFLVETRHQFDHHRHFLTRARRAQQVFHQHRACAGAIDGHLDRHHLRIVGGLLQELDHRGEGLERVMQQDVVLPDVREHIGALGHHLRHAGVERRVFQVRTIDAVGNRDQPDQIDDALDAIEILALESELLQQELGHHLGTVVGDL